MMKRKISKEKANLKAAIAWYKPNQWQRLREISEDRDELEETYGEWRILAEKAMQDFAAQELSVTKATVDTFFIDNTKPGNRLCGRSQNT